MDPEYAPKIVGWEATLACNLRCIHCGSVAGQSRPGELSTEEALHMCRDLAGAGSEVLVLSGGEPLLRRDWDRVAALAVELGLTVRMISNGMLVADQIDRIRASGVAVVGLSLDGMAPTHNMIRRDQRSFASVIEAVERLAAAGIRASVVTHVSRFNLDELDDLHELLAGLPVSAWQIQLAFPAGRMADLRDQVIAPRDLPRVASFIAQARAANRVRVYAADDIGYYTDLEPQLRDKEWGGCFAGLWVAGIESDGAVKGCLSLPPAFRAGNIRQRPIAEIWADADQFAYNRFFSPDLLEGACRGCDRGEECRGGCTVTAYTYTGSRFNNPYCLYGLARDAGRA